MVKSGTFKKGKRIFNEKGYGYGVLLVEFLESRGLIYIVTDVNYNEENLRNKSASPRCIESKTVEVSCYLWVSYVPYFVTSSSPYIESPYECGLNPVYGQVSQTYSIYIIAGEPWCNWSYWCTTCAFILTPYYEVALCGSPVSLDLLRYDVWAFMFDSLTLSMLLPVSSMGWSIRSSQTMKRGNNSDTHSRPSVFALPEFLNQNIGEDKLANLSRGKEIATPKDLLFGSNPTGVVIIRMDSITAESFSDNNGAAVPYTSGSSSAYGRAGGAKNISGTARVLRLLLCAKDCGIRALSPFGIKALRKTGFGQIPSPGRPSKNSPCRLLPLLLLMDDSPFFPLDLSLLDLVTA
ncbi:hypothetical protein ACFE04_011476 [Oxalis oulophora]